MTVFSHTRGIRRCRNCKTFFFPRPKKEFSSAADISRTLLSYVGNMSDPNVCSAPFRNTLPYDSSSRSGLSLWRPCHCTTNSAHPPSREFWCLESPQVKTTKDVQHWSWQRVRIIFLWQYVRIRDAFANTVIERESSCGAIVPAVVSGFLFCHAQSFQVPFHQVSGSRL